MSRTPSSAAAQSRVAIALAALSIGLTLPRFAAARPQGEATESSSPLRAVVWLQPGTSEVLDRIRGQTNDLRLELLVDSVDPMPDESGAQIRAAYALGEQHQASIVIWFVNQGDTERHFVVNIAIPATQRLLTRDLGPSEADPEGARLSSAVKESAALVVRAAFQAVLSGLTIGEVQTAGPNEIAAPPAPSAPAIQAPIAPIASGNPGPWHDATEPPRQASDAPREPPASSTGRNWPWGIGVEWLSIYDGPSGNPVAECAALRAERRVRSVMADIAGGGCLNRNFDAVPASYGSFRIARQQATLGAHWILMQQGIEASIGVRASAVFYERSTLTPVPLGVQAQSSSLHVLGALGPEFRLLFPARDSRFQAGFALGVDFLTNPLQLGYIVQSSFSETTHTYAIQPYAAFGLVLRL